MSDNLSLEIAVWNIKSIVSPPSPANRKSLDTTLAEAPQFYSTQIPQDEFQTQGWDLKFAMFPLQVEEKKRPKSPEHYPD